MSCIAAENHTMVAIDLSANENPLGASPRALEAVARHLGGIHRYPDDDGTELKAALAAKLGVGS